MRGVRVREMEGKRKGGRGGGRDELRQWLTLLLRQAKTEPLSIINNGYILQR